MLLVPRSRSTIRRLRAIVVYLSLTCRVLTIVRVSSVVRCVSTVVVYGARGIIICRICAIVGPTLESEYSAPDVEVFDIVEEVGRHQGARRAEFCSQSGGQTAYILYTWEAVRILYKAQVRKNKSICMTAQNEPPQGNPSDKHSIVPENG